MATATCPLCLETKELVTKNSADKSKQHKKQSLAWHWKRASRAKQLKWVAEGIGLVAGLCILGIYVFGYFRTNQIALTRSSTFGPGTHTHTFPSDTQNCFRIVIFDWIGQRRSASVSSRRNARLAYLAY